jgi:hypothetical protein
MDHLGIDMKRRIKECWVLTYTYSTRAIVRIAAATFRTHTILIIFHTVLTIPSIPPSIAVALWYMRHINLEVERAVQFIKIGGVEKESNSDGISVMAYCFEEMRSKFSQTKYVKSTLERGPHLVETSIPKTKNFMEKESFETL